VYVAYYAHSGFKLWNTRNCVTIILYKITIKRRRIKLLYKYIEIILFQNLKGTEIQSYINVEFSVVQHKLIKRHAELENQAKYFQVINIEN